MQKLVAVTVTFNGRQVTVFTLGTLTESGKTVVSMDMVNDILKRLGCIYRGQTYSMG